MEKLLRKQVVEIANQVFDNCDIVAKHGTSLSSAVSIMETGFDYDKTSMIGQASKDPVKLCAYGWKESKRGEASNVILAIPKSFIMKLNGFDEKQYNEWVKQRIVKGSDAEMLLYAVSDKKETGITSFGGITLPGIEKCHLPREFVKGSFFFCDNTNYMDFLQNPEEALDHLAYMDNEYFFDNLTPEEQDKFVDEFKGKKRQPAK